MIAVSDVEASSRWYQKLLGFRNNHGGSEHQRLLSDGAPLLQLHHRGVEDHHGLFVNLQRDDAAAKGQQHRIQLFDEVLNNLDDSEAS